MTTDWRTGNIRLDTFEELRNYMVEWLEASLIDRYNIFDDMDVDIYSGLMAEAAWKALNIHSGDDAEGE